MLAVKLGGSLITDKKVPKSYKGHIVRELAPYFPEKFILGHGGGSFGHYEASRGPRDLFWYARVRRAMKELNVLVLGDLISSGIPGVGIHPGDYWERLGEVVTRIPGVPVVHGDVLPSLEIVSAEEVFLKLVREGIVDRVILVSSVEGVLDERGQVIPLLERGRSLEDRGVEGYDVTGGMREKVMKGFEMLEAGAKEVIITGKDGFKRIMEGEEAGTRLVL